MQFDTKTSDKKTWTVNKRKSSDRWMLAQRDGIYKIKHLRSRRKNMITQRILVPTYYKKKSHVSTLLIIGTQKREISKPEKR